MNAAAALLLLLLGAAPATPTVTFEEPAVGFVREPSGRWVCSVRARCGPVLIEVVESWSGACSTRNERNRAHRDDGRYEVVISFMTNSVACFHHAQWVEEWTDYPERDGTFIRRVELVPM